MGTKTLKYLPLALLLGFSMSPVLADEREQSTVEKIVDVQHDLFKGPREGLRSNHTKGVVLTGEFHPAESARQITSAAHLQQDSSPIVVRFSNATGFPDIADNDPKGLAKGMAMRIDLGDEEYTDMVLSSVPRFPVATPEAFLEMLTAVRDSATSEADTKPIQQFLADNPKAKHFVEYPKPFPASFANLSYHGINAFKFTNTDGESVYGRYIVTPLDGVKTLKKVDAEAQNQNYLMNEIRERLPQQPAEFRLSVQVAEPSDEVNDATIIWPDDRQIVELGTIVINAAMADAATYEKATMFNPLALPEGIEPSADPILLARPGAYAVSFQHRMD